MSLRILIKTCYFQPKSLKILENPGILNYLSLKSNEIGINCSKYRFNCSLTKDPSETSSLVINKNKLYSSLPLLYQHMFLCVNESTLFNWVL